MKYTLMRYSSETNNLAKLFVGYQAQTFIIILKFRATGNGHSSSKPLSYPLMEGQLTNLLSLKGF